MFSRVKKSTHVFFVTFGDYKDPKDGGSRFTRELLSALEGLVGEVRVFSYYSGSFFDSRLLRKLLSIFYLFSKRLPLPVSYFYSRRLSREIFEAVDALLSSHSGQVRIKIFLDHLELGYLSFLLRSNYGEAIELYHVSHNCEPDLFEQRLRGTLVYWASERICSYRQFEEKFISQVDGVLSISERERNYFRSMPCFSGEAGPKIETIPPIFTYPVNRRGQGGRRNVKLVYLANFDWWPNVEGFNWLLECLVPILPHECHLHVYGKGSERYASGLPGNVTAHGFVADIGDVWDECLFSLAPIASGAGVNIKVAESLYNKVPVIGTAQAFDGLEGSAVQGGVLLELKPELWVQAILSYVSDSDRYRDLVSSINYPCKDEVTDRIEKFL